MNELNQFLENIHIAAKRFQEWLNSIDWDKVRDVFEYISSQLPAEVQKLSIELANRGWFVWNMNEPLESFVEKLSGIINKPTDEQDEFISKYIEAEMDDIEHVMMKNYPERKDQIKDAFSTHKAGYYYSSIPALISISEGVCKDNFPDIGLYSKHPKNGNNKPGQPRTSDIFDQAPPLDVFEEAVLKPLKISSNITKSIFKPTKQEHAMFNRHLIIHGTSKRYGNKINSLKAISLLYYVHTSLKYLNSKRT